MNVTWVQYFIILAVGGGLIKLLLYNGKLREMLSSLERNKIFYTGVLTIWALLFWPTDTGQAFGQDDALGYLRVARVACFLLMFSAFFSYMYKKPGTLRNSTLSLYIGYAGVCLLSSLYSPNWLETVWKSFELLVLIMFAMVIRKEIDLGRLTPTEVVQGVSFLIFATVAFAFVGGVLYPNIAYSASGEYSKAVASMGGIVPRVNANTLGQLSAMLAFMGFFVAFIQKRLRPDALLLLVFGVAGMIMAHARTSIIAFIIVAVLVGLVRGTGRSWLVMLALLVAGFYLQDYVYEYIKRGQSEDVFLSMSGRTYMWSIAWDSFLAQPWLGTGFYAGHKTLGIQIDMPYSSLDNTYLEALVDVGLVGTAFLATFIFMAFLRSANMLILYKNRSSKDFTSVGMIFGFLMLMLVRSMLGPSFQVLHINLMILLLFSVVLDAYHESRGRVSRVHKLQQSRVML